MFCTLTFVPIKIAQNHNLKQLQNQNANDQNPRDLSRNQKLVPLVRLLYKTESRHLLFCGKILLKLLCSLQNEWRDDFMHIVEINPHFIFPERNNIWACTMYIFLAIVQRNMVCLAAKERIKNFLRFSFFLTLFI